MLTRRQTLQTLGGTLGALGVAPVLSACTSTDSVQDHPAATDLRLVKTDVAQSAGDPAAVAGVVGAMTAFAVDLWPELGSSSDNLAMSPYSIDTDLAITDVLHQTYVAVDEAGTEAAAATAVVVGETSLPVSRYELVLDRPFVYVVHDTAHGTPLFVGRVADPS